ncbi:MAG: HyaD/HybD family hydrogenase maturation endopeptidase [Gemmatimonadetes bacterium]|nr:HyaD/HybD family hydrogenase maturation endopeptidase [Gemmatimonadota bacterium]
MSEVTVRRSDGLTVDSDVRAASGLDRPTVRPSDRPSGTVVIGLGNPLMADDGAGIAALERLREFDFDPPVELVDGGTWGLNLLPVIEDAERLVLLDAINVGARPGTTVVLERPQIPRYLSTKVSPHQIALSEVLALAELRGRLPEHTVAIGLQPERVEMTTELSPAVERALDRVVVAAVSRLGEWGHSRVRSGERGARSGSSATVHSALRTPQSEIDHA